MVDGRGLANRMRKYIHLAISWLGNSGYQPYFQVAILFHKPALVEMSTKWRGSKYFYVVYGCPPEGNKKEKPLESRILLDKYRNEVFIML